ncbi:MAG: hypothetical protein K6F97_05120 [Lachnospiraceae bacterium]|nr:hypothetical protein [Lachnospiraceae bacterium]
MEGVQKGMTKEEFMDAPKMQKAAEELKWTAIFVVIADIVLLVYSYNLFEKGTHEALAIYSNEEIKKLMMLVMGFIALHMVFTIIIGIAKNDLSVNLMGIEVIIGVFYWVFNEQPEYLSMILFCVVVGLIVLYRPVGKREEAWREYKRNEKAAEKAAISYDIDTVQGESVQIDSARIIAADIEEINKLPRGLSKNELYNSKYLKKINKTIFTNFALIEGAGIFYLIMLIISHFGAYEISFKEQLGDKIAVLSMASIGVLAISLIVLAVSYKLHDHRPLGIILIGVLIFAVFSFVSYGEVGFLIATIIFYEMYISMLKFNRIWKRYNKTY